MQPIAEIYRKMLFRIPKNWYAQKIKIVNVTIFIFTFHPKIQVLNLNIERPITNLKKVEHMVRADCKLRRMTPSAGT